MKIGDFTINPKDFTGKWRFVGQNYEIEQQRLKIAVLRREFNRLLFKRRSKQKRHLIHAKLKKARVELVALTLARE